MTTRSTLASALFSAAASLALALPTTALAAMPGASVSVTVPTRDLDLGSAAGRAALDQRLRHAAIEACGEASSADPAGKRLLRQCRAELVRAGQAQALAAAARQQERLAAR